MQVEFICWVYPFPAAATRMVMTYLMLATILHLNFRIGLFPKLFILTKHKAKL